MIKIKGFFEKGIADRLQRAVKNKKGIGTIGFVLGVLFLFGIIILSVDAYRMTYIYMDVASITTEVTELVSIQGGISEVPPEQYPDKTNYITRNEICDYVFDSMYNKGIEKGDLKIEYRLKDGTKSVYTLGSGPANINIDYGSPITVTLRYKFDFTIVPDSWEDDSSVYKCTRKGISQYKHRSAEGWAGDNE